MKVVVFDLGGTLMQYKGMPDSWVDFYKTGFEAIHQKYDDNVTEEAIEKSVQMLAEFNPRLSGREIEYSAEFIFTKVLEHWCVTTTIQNCIETFWDGLKLKAEIYSDCHASNYCSHLRQLYRRLNSAFPIYCLS